MSESFWFEICLMIQDWDKETPTDKTEQGEHPSAGLLHSVHPDKGTQEVDSERDTGQPDGQAGGEAGHAEDTAAVVTKIRNRLVISDSTHEMSTTVVRVVVLRALR